VFQQQALLCQFHNAQNHLSGRGEDQAPADSNGPHQRATRKATKPKGARTFVLIFNVIFSTHICPVSTDDHSSSACDFRQGRRAYAWAKRVSEVEQYQFPLKVAETDGPTRMGGQGKVGRTWQRLADDAVKDVGLFACEPWRASAQRLR